MATTASYRRFEVGRVLTRTGGAIARNGRVFILLALLISGSVTFFAGLGQTQFGGSSAGGDWWYRTSQQYEGWGALAFLLSIAAQAILQLAITRATILDLVGRPIDPRECFMAGARLFLPAIGLTIVYWIAIVVGSLFLLVPGIIIAVMWSVGVPALVEERGGVFASLARSRTLTKGARWKLFALLLLYTGALLAVGSVQAVLLLAVGGLALTGLLVNAIVSALLSMVLSVVTAVAYVELREIKEGVGTAELADIFA